MKGAALVLTALTLNVAGPRRVHQGWQSRREALTVELAARRPDVAAFQAVWREEDAQALAAAAGHPYHAHEPSLGLELSSRLPIVDHAARDLGGGYGILRAGVQLDSATADVYTLRLEPGDGPAAARRLRQILDGAEFARESSPQRPVLILGDLSASSVEDDSELFLYLLGARDLCVSHGDEMCGRTLEDRRVDYALIPYSSRSPRETARTAFTGVIADGDENRPLSTHYGLAVGLERAWLPLRFAAEPEGRVEALTEIADLLDRAHAAAQERAKRAGWIPWRGTIDARHERDEAGRFAAAAERARSALARVAKPVRSVYD